MIYQIMRQAITHWYKREGLGTGYFLDAVSQGAKLCLYQGFREWDFQPIHWGGLVDLDGNPTDRLKSAEEIGALLKQMKGAVSSGKREKAKIAIAICKENAIILKGMDREKYLLQALRGAYRVFWEKYYQVDFISEGMLTKEHLKQYQMVYFPFYAYMTEEMASETAGYVEQGGTIIGTARMGKLGKHGWRMRPIYCGIFWIGFYRN